MTQQPNPPLGGDEAKVDLWFERLSKALQLDDPVSFYGLHGLLSGEPPLNCLLSDAGMAVKALGSLDAHLSMMLRASTIKGDA